MNHMQLRSQSQASELKPSMVIILSFIQSYIVSLSAALEYIYCEEVKLNEDLTLELLELSEKFMLAELQIMCEEYLSESLSLDNFIDTAKRINCLDVKYLRVSVSKFIIDNIVEIKEKVDLSQVPKEILVETLYKQHNI